MKTYSAKPDDIKRDWYVVNASGKTLGRLATEIEGALEVNIKLSTRHIWTRVITLSLSMQKIFK